MFGRKAYKYSLRVPEEMPSTIYKERNINIPVELIDKSSEKILNCKTFK
jgi:hypothetical protein